MGYYITFVFDPSQVRFNRDKLIAKFLKVGAREKKSGFGEGKAYSYNGHLLSFGDYKPEALKNGLYADARFSWASEPDELVRALTGLLDLADRLGCRLYDGQLDLWITRENLNEIMKHFNKQSERAIGLIGKINKR
jgi:hypothetical protein